MDTAEHGKTRQQVRKRVSGRSFAIGFALFLVIGTLVFTYLARQAQLEREAAWDRMQEDGLLPPAPTEPRDGR
ncbi:MAG: hypothetical protein K1X94_33190 [Sandaracinaceae bacterium]|jgi:hypothetical protein|nr:hypothetical protein [Sandaracinaceae bacterium]